jgi:UDP-N-acetylglucosamine 1-carboxyvinyltransferase
MHLAALRKMGVDIREEGGGILCRAVNGRAKGAKLSLAFPSVGATENIILCAATAEGETVINNAAREPEICDLCGFLRSCGAEISGDGGSRIMINGKKQLNGCEYTIMPDRIAGATYLSMTACAGGEMILNNACVPEMEPFLNVLEQTGCSIYTMNDRIYLRSGSRLRAVPDRIRTMPHPGFPTDAQAVIMAALTVAEGTSVFEENIFDCRYRHTDALVKMGADIQVMGKIAVVRGVPALHGAKVEATDLRGGAAMVCAALAAEGVTEIGTVSHIDRGYVKIEETVARLGGSIRRV